MNAEKARRMAQAFARGLAFMRGHALMAMDANKNGETWITIGAEPGPDGKKHGGQPVCLNSNGEIKYGLGKAAQGKTLGQVFGKGGIYSKEGKKGAKQPAQAGRKDNTPPDFTLPEKVNPEEIQNRDRSGAASTGQIRAIASKPDYLRLGFSTTMADGAPIVAYGKIDRRNLGRISTVTDNQGNRTKVQYAVMEAGDVAASHDSRGDKNDKFYSDDPTITRAIAGNGRMAGLQRAYTIGTAGDYREMLLEDDLHGVDPKVIKSMKQPVLVRVMSPQDVTADIGDRSNIASGLTFNAVGQAVNDVKRLKAINSLTHARTYASGLPTVETVQDFIEQMPESERGALLDSTGHPTRQAQDRLQAALFHAAYQSEPLTRLAAQAMDDGQKRIINGLMGAAARVTDIADTHPQIRQLISNSAERAVEAARAGNLRDAEGERDMFKSDDADAAERAILQIFTRSTSAAAMASKLRAVASELTAEHDRINTKQESLFAYEPRSDREVIEAALEKWDRDHQK